MDAMAMRRDNQSSFGVAAAAGQSTDRGSITLVLTGI